MVCNHKINTKKLEAVVVKGVNLCFSDAESIKCV